MDDLTVLEKINLLVLGLASFNCHTTVPSNIPDHNQFIPAQHLKSQCYLDEIKEWTEKQKIVLNQKKTKVMLFNFTENHKFITSLKLNGETLDVVQQAKLLGVIISNDLKWDKNTEYLIFNLNRR